MIYDERRRTLTRTIKTDKSGESTKFEIILDEDGIKNVFNALLQDKKDGKRAIDKQEDLLDAYEKQAKETPKVPMDKRLQQMRTDLILLQKRQEWDKHHERIQGTKDTIKHITAQVKEKTRLLNELKGKCRNINLIEQ